MSDPFLKRYDESELRVASEFLTHWLPFLSTDLCPNCTHILSRRVLSLSSHVDTGQSASNDWENSSTLMSNNTKIEDDNCDAHSLGSWKDEAESNSLVSSYEPANDWSDSFVSSHDPASGWPQSPVAENLSSSELLIGSLSVGFVAPMARMSRADIAQENEHKGGGELSSGESNGFARKKIELSTEQRESSSEIIIGSLSVGLVTPMARKSRADMAQENENEGGGELSSGESNGFAGENIELPREQRESLRIKYVRKKDFICLQRVDGKLINILQGLELHTGVLSDVEQKKIVDYVYQLVEKGKKGELKEHTYTAPRKWMKGKGRVTIQFGCCYNYVTDKKGNPPGILTKEEVDPLPSLFKVIIRRLVRWGVFPPSCVPDSCIVNVYDEGDCIPPHIDNHDFVRPFCTISFLSECNILFGIELKIQGPGEFKGDFAIPLPVGSVLVLNGNGADVAKHCVPAVPSKRISITFRRMDESKRPIYYIPEPDLQDLKPLCLVQDIPEPDNGSNTASSAPPRLVKQTAPF